MIYESYKSGNAEVELKDDLINVFFLKLKLLKKIN